MAYRVEVSPNAVHEIEQAFRWINHDSPQAAVRWYNGLMDALHGLGG